MSILKVEDVYYDYVTKAVTTHALNGVNAAFERGKTYAIIGRSGSGKTTLLSLLAALDRPKSGVISFDGKPIYLIDDNKYRRENIGLIFQAYNLIPQLTALENVTLSLELIEAPKSERKKRALEALENVGLTSAHAKKFPLQLSGGEQQRVAIARAIVTEPMIILADEPTGNLDNENSDKIVAILKRLAHEKNKCVIIVTHSSEVAAQTDEVLSMSDGKMTE